MRTGSDATAIAVLMSTASAPTSIASAASLGTPRPASTTTGTPACSTMTSIASRVRSPRLEPIHAPSGITVAQPASSRWRHSTGSALQYGSTTKPSPTSRSAARSVSIGSGASVRGSGVTSSLTKSALVAARPRRASRTASSASTAPEVFGSSVMAGGTKSRMSPSPARLRSTRRSATVTISAPEASSASRMTVCAANLPVPTSSREVNGRPPMTSGSAVMPRSIRHSPRGHYPDRVLRVAGGLGRPLSPSPRAPRYVGSEVTPAGGRLRRRCDGESLGRPTVPYRKGGAVFPFDQLDRLEELRGLDPAADRVSQIVHGAVRPAGLKDLLHGTWLGHPLHPILVQVTIGGYVGATTLDLLGGEDHERAADLLAALGL